eukprot:11237173-Alexandrium_andersonii.AAC.1
MSQAWRTDGWPGCLALFSSPLASEREAAWEAWLADHALFARCAELSQQEPFWKRVCAISPFETTLMADIAALALGATAESKAHVQAELATYTQRLFEGWGQTKI